MRCIAAVMATLFGLTLLVQPARAERAPQSREIATHVVVGVIKKIDTEEFGFSDGIETRYSAQIVVEKIDKGKGVKTNDTITIGWFHVTKRPSRPIPGAYGREYPAAVTGGRVRVWLIHYPDSADYGVIYNSSGMEAAK